MKIGGAPLDEDCRRIKAILGVMGAGGNLLCLNLVGGLGLGGCEAYTGVFGGFGTEVRIENGYATLPQSPGRGFEAQPELIATMIAGIKSLLKESPR